MKVVPLSPSPLDLPNMLHELGRGARTARALSRANTRALFAAMLAGENDPHRIGDLELGGILIAYRIKGESADELAGMLEACQASLYKVELPAGCATPVVIPSYNGARKLPNLTPLLALELARRGVPVLVHGDAADAYERIASASVFAALGIAPCMNTRAVESALATHHLAFAPLATLSPALAHMLALRERLGVRGPAHTLVKLIQPFTTPALRLVNYTHPQYREEMAQLFLDANIAGTVGVLLARGSEGEALADPRRQVEVEWLRDGRATTLVEATPGDGSLPELPDTRDAATTARWIERALTGEVPLPASLARQIETICGICIQNNNTSAAAIALAR